MILRKFSVWVGAVVLGVCTAGQASADVLIDLDGYEHGRIMNHQLSGITIEAVNLRKPHDLAVIFDSRQRNTRDLDLEGPNGIDGSWSVGNIASDEVLGNLLIIQENDAGAETGIVLHPDDEGSGSPTGQLRLTFEFWLTHIGFDLIDIDGPDEFTEDHGYVAFLSDGQEVGRIGWGEFISPASRFYDPTIVYGDNSANRIDLISAGEAFDIPVFNEVVFSFYSSGAIGNIRYIADEEGYIPEPATLTLLALGAMALTRRSRRS